MTNKEIRKYLFDNQDKEYRLFQIKLTPGVDPESVIGVRLPIIKAFAKELVKTSEYEGFIADIPHEYYDEMNLHAFILSELKDYDRVISELDKFLPYVDNWATCDSLIPKKAFKKRLDSLDSEAKKWMAETGTYTIRFGIKILMTFYLDNEFKPEYLDMVSAVESDEYYVNMMKAWYFATALAKQYEATIPYIEQKRLDDWTHKKTIQKARESFRISPEQKEYLKSLK